MTFCEDCTNVRKPAKNAPPWRWLCVRHPRLEGYGYVTKSIWDDFPPFLNCNAVNGGACPLFEKKSDDWEDILLEAKRKGTNL